MTVFDCPAMAEAIEPLAAGETASPAQQAHLDGCASCRARLALARRLERVLAEWPTPAAAPELADQVLAAARREAWRREVVVDWSFNLAIAAGLAAIVAGLGGLAWLFGSAAGPEATSALVIDATAELLSRLRGQAAVTGTAVLLLTTTLAAWWWAER